MPPPAEYKRKVDFGVEARLLNEEAVGGGETLFMVLGAERKALILKDDDGTTAARSYSSMRLARSSSEVIDTKASRSSVGNWHLKLTDDPHISLIFTNNSIIYEENNILKFPQNHT